jgi:hypothetical protein
MMLIERVTSREFLKDHEIIDLKPQNPTAPTITMDVPSSSVAPRPSCSVLAAPHPPRSSSSMGGVLMVIKSMFAWCRDNRQCQDVLLRNQRCQNEKMSIDEFDEFSHPMPPLDDDPFASLSAADLTTMEANDDDAEDGSNSEYEEEEGGGDDEDYDK